MDNQPDSIKPDNILKTILGSKKRRLIAIAVIAVGVVVYLGLVIKIPYRNPLTILQKKAEVQLKTEYKNPFAKKTQFVNPFDKYKNPFVVNRQ